MFLQCNAFHECATIFNTFITSYMIVPSTSIFPPNLEMMQIGDEYYEDLDSASAEEILKALKAGETPKVGSQAGRHTCEPAGGITSLTDRYPDRAAKSGGDD